MEKTELERQVEEEEEVISEEEINKILLAEFVSLADKEPEHVKQEPEYKSTFFDNLVSYFIPYQVKKETNKVSVFDDINNINNMNIKDMIKINETQQSIGFIPERRFGMDKIVSINNISGKNAWVLITPAPIKSIETVGIGFREISFNVSFTEKGEYKVQQIPILNNTKTKINLHNTEFYCTLILDIDGKLIKTWEKLFNSKKYDINILERHVEIAKTMTSL